MFFGQKLKELRLKYANMGLHNFAKEIEMNALDYYNVEKGYVEPPTEMSWIANIIETLNLKREDEVILLDLWSKPFIMQKMKDIGLPLFAHKENGEMLNVNEMQELHLSMKNMVKTHNKKAEEYNKKSKGF